MDIARVLLAGGMGGYNGYSGVQTNQELYSACMKARGYSWQPDKSSGQQ
jgi:hypothetical protein